MESSSSEKNLLKPLKITIFRPNLCKTGVLMGHAQNKKQFFFSEIIKPDPKLSKPFYFNKISYVLAALWMFFYIVWCFLLKSVISSHNRCGASVGFELINFWYWRMIYPLKQSPKINLFTYLSNYFRICTFFHIYIHI